jgi:putative peptidoglycan lipid II flippase
MGGVLWWFGGDLAAWVGSSVPERVVWLGALVVGGLAAYFGVLFALGVRVRHFRLGAATAK